MAYISFSDRTPMGREAYQSDAEDIAMIEVWLAEPIERIKGQPWPSSKTNGKPLSLTAIQKPSYFIIHLPSGKVLESFAKTAIIENNDGFVSEVVLWTLPDLAGSYSEVVDAAETLVERWGIDNKKLDASLIAWREIYNEDPLLLPEDEREPVTKRYANAEIEPDIWLSPVRDIHKNSKGWYLKVSIFAGDAVDRKMGRKVIK